MKCAIITPHSMLELSSPDYHLVLAQELLKEALQEADQRPYTDFFAEAQGYKILDNGAAEGETISDPGQLLGCARQINADEIVVPDVIGDAMATAATVKLFEKHTLPDEFNYMAVVQGSTMQEILRMVQLYEELEWITTIALPRHLLKTFGDDIRMHLARIIQNETRFKKENIHCLGAGSWTQEVRALARQDLVRGMDTSLPINFGLLGHPVTDDLIIKRQPDYFSRTLTRTDPLWRLISDNVRTYLGWAGYVDLGDTTVRVEPNFK